MSRKKRVKRLEMRVARLESHLDSLEGIVFNIARNFLSDKARTNYPDTKILLDQRYEIATWICLVRAGVPLSKYHPLPDTPMTEEESKEYIADIWAIEVSDIDFLSIDIDTAYVIECVETTLANRTK